MSINRAYFDRVTWTKYALNLTPQDRLDEIEGQLEITGWRIKDKAKALEEVERPDGVIEIVRVS